MAYRLRFFLKLKAQYGLQGSITQIGVVTSGVPTSIQRQILATHKEPN
jgi:hypothetical protein